MSKPIKILIVRFSSIGDIVLTSPVVRCLKNQIETEIHFLTKYKYHSLLVNNKYLDKIYYLESSFSSTLKELKKENYDYIIDLHNNIRSFFLLRLGVKITRYYKSNFHKILNINFGLKLNKKIHTVDRYMQAVKFLGVKNDGKGLDFFLDKNNKIDFNLNQNFIAWSIGGSFEQKQLSVEQVHNVCSNLLEPVILLGGENEKNKADEIINLTKNKNVFNFCGKLTINESAYVIKKCTVLLSNDTGLMHVGAALKKNILSFWGCTKPDIGFSPYMPGNKSIELISTKSKRQCSKHGSSCKFTKEGCVKEISVESILDSLKKVLY